MHRSQRYDFRHEAGSFLPKDDKDLLIINNWRPITLLTLDYKIFNSSLFL